MKGWESIMCVIPILVRTTGTSGIKTIENERTNHFETIHKKDISFKIYWNYIKIPYTIRYLHIKERTSAILQSFLNNVVEIDDRRIDTVDIDLFRC